MRTSQKLAAYKSRGASQEPLRSYDQPPVFWKLSPHREFNIHVLIKHRKLSSQSCICIIFAHLNSRAFHSTLLVPLSQAPCLHSTQPFYHDHFLLLLYSNIRADLSLVILLLLEEPLHSIHTALRRRGRLWRFTAVFIAAWVPAFVACQEGLDFAHKIFGGQWARRQCMVRTTLATLPMYSPVPRVCWGLRVGCTRGMISWG